MLHLEDGTHVRVPDGDLPVTLPQMEDFKPSDDGSAPLARATEWVSASDPASGGPARRDTDTMPGWAGSCWYYLRFMDPKCDTGPLSAEAEDYWGNVDLYIGGTEHAVLHLLYARFWHKVLYDAGVVKTKEPFQRLFNQGMLTAFAYKDGTGRLVPTDEVDLEVDPPASRVSGEPLEQVIAKMSKSLKNVVNPDDVCAEYGVDTFRLYEMFMGPLADSKPWNPRDVPGPRKFLERSWRLFVDPEGEAPLRPGLDDATEVTPEGPALEVERALNQCLQRVDDSFKAFNFNTAVAAFMEFLKGASSKGLNGSQASRFVRAMAPFAPHFADEIWSRMGHPGSVHHAAWPAVDERYLKSDEFEMPVQILGKLRAKVMVPREASRDEMEAAARAAVADRLEGKEVVKTIVVPGRLVNFVVK